MKPKQQTDRRPHEAGTVLDGTPGSYAFPVGHRENR
jgi:hypothetical protein